jgi:hypothetical protein
LTTLYLKYPTSKSTKIPIFQSSINQSKTSNMSSKSQAQATTTDELMGYVYKVSCYESKRHRTSHTDVYYATPQDCQWALDSCDYKRGLIQIHLIQVKQSDMKYQSAHQNRKSQAEPEAAAAEPSDVSDVTFDGSALDEALFKDNLDWQFQRPTNGIEYSTVYIYEPAVDVEPEDESEAEDEPEPEAEATSDDQLLLEAEWRLQPDATDDELPEALRMVEEAIEVEDDGFETIEEAEAEAPPPSTFECCVCMDEQVLSLQYPLPCSHGLCMGCYQEMSKNGCNMKCPCCRGPLDENRPTAPTSDSLADPEQQELQRESGIDSRGENFAESLARHDRNYERAQEREQASASSRGLIGVWKNHPPTGRVMIQRRNELADKVWQVARTWPVAEYNAPRDHSRYIETRTKLDKMARFINTATSIHQLNDIQEDFIEQYRKFDIQLQLRDTPDFPTFRDQVPNQHRHYNRQCCRIYVQAQRAPRRCGLCNETGHNRRSCPSK